MPVKKIKRVKPVKKEKMAMRKKKRLLSTLAMCCALSLACAGGAVMSASAGIKINSPVGDGMMQGGNINAENFMTLDDTDPSAYAVSKGNTTYTLNNVAWRNALISPMAKVPKADLVDGAKIIMQYDIYSYGSQWAQCIYFAPFTKTQGWGENYLTANMYNAGPRFQAAPTGAQTIIKGTTADVNYTDIMTDFGIGIDQLTAQKNKGRDYVTTWIEYDITARTMKVYSGNAEANEKVEYGTLTNAFTLDTSADGYYFNFGLDEKNIEFDNFKLYREYNDETTTYADFDFEDNSKIISTGDTEKSDCLVIKLGETAGTKGFKTYSTSIAVTNPAADTRLSTLNPLKVDDSLTTTFEMTAGLALNTVTKEQKVGIAFGLNKYNTKLSAPAEGASFLYLTLNDDGDIILAAENIAADGAETAVGTANVLTGVALGDTIELGIKGAKGGNITVTVDENDFTFEGLKLNGNLSFTQKGTGNMTYTILPDLFEVTGYEFIENESEAVTANFNESYLSSVKFDYQSKPAPEEYVIMDNASHELTGLTAEDGKVGFYGTSTNTRLMFKGEYADFVLQFDYISSPYKTRAIPSGLATGSAPNRFSPFYILFGAENSIPELSMTHAIGLIDGNATQYFWGAESLISCEGKLSGVTALSVLKEADAETAETIPWYTAAGECNKHGVPDTETSYVYSLYNKTSRIKLVAVNNNVALYAAEVGTDGEIVGEYTLLWKQIVSDASGYVGFGTDAPGWYEIDNVAITPISKEKAIELGVNTDSTKTLAAVNLAADVAAADMESDPVPVMLEKPVLTVDTTNKKVTWNAVANAASYNVLVTKGTGEDKETLIDQQNITATEIDLSSLAYGEYAVVVTAVAADPALYLDSTSRTTYKYEETVPDGGDNKEEDDGGCNSAIGIAPAALLIAAGSAFVALRKRKEN